MEQQLKQRLIGVTIVVALVVIFVPMLFDRSGDRTAGTPDGIPPIPDEVVETKPIELPKSADDIASEEKEAIPESGYKIVPLTDDPQPAAKQNTGEKAQTAAVDAASGAGEEESLEEDDGAGETEGQKAQPVEEDLPPIATPKTAKGGKAAPGQEPKKSKAAVVPSTQVTQVKKVEAPPAKDKGTQAKGAAAAVKPADAPSRKAEPTSAAPKKAAKGTGPETVAKAQVAPSTAAAAAKSGGEGSGVPSTWVVQTGSFTTESKAVALVEKLRQSKYPAFIERVQADSGTMFRVKVGPELERGRAEQVQKQIEASVGIKGIIIQQR